MSKPTDKSKDQVRSRRQRNLVAKYNPHKGGYHTTDKYTRPRYNDWEGLNDLEMEYNDGLR